MKYVLLTFLKLKLLVRITCHQIREGDEHPLFYSDRIPPIGIFPLDQNFHGTYGPVCQLTAFQFKAWHISLKKKEKSLTYFQSGDGPRHYKRCHPVSNIGPNKKFSSLTSWGTFAFPLLSAWRNVLLLNTVESLLLPKKVAYQKLTTVTVIQKRTDGQMWIFTKYYIIHL